MHWPVTVRRTQGKEARHSRISSSRKGTSGGSVVGRTRRRRSAVRGELLAPPGAQLRPGEAHGRPSAAAARAGSVPSLRRRRGRTSVRHRSSTRRPAISSHRTRARAGRLGVDEARAGPRAAARASPAGPGEGAPESVSRRAGGSGAATTASATRRAAASGTVGPGGARRRRADARRRSSSRSSTRRKSSHWTRESTSPCWKAACRASWTRRSSARGTPGQLPAPGPAPLPERVGVEGEEAGARAHAAVQLDEAAGGRVGEGPGVVAAGELGEAPPPRGRRPPRASAPGPARPRRTWAGPTPRRTPSRRGARPSGAGPGSPAPRGAPGPGRPGRSAPGCARGRRGGPSARPAARGPAQEDGVGLGGLQQEARRAPGRGRSRPRPRPTDPAAAGAAIRPPRAPGAGPGPPLTRPSDERRVPLWGVVNDPSGATERGQGRCSARGFSWRRWPPSPSCPSSATPPPATRSATPSGPA